jgi:hypothetical protein
VIVRSRPLFGQAAETVTAVMVASVADDPERFDATIRSPPSPVGAVVTIGNGEASRNLFVGPWIIALGRKLLEEYRKAWSDLNGPCLAVP